MKLYVIRHGQTACNIQNKYNCRYDEDINEVGIEQAKKASKFVNDLNIDLIYCSPMKRTKHTMELVNVNNIPVIYDDRLIERDGGILTLTTLDEFHEKEFYNYYSTEYVEGLETLPEVFERVHLFLEEIKEKYKENQEHEQNTEKRILIVTHGIVARAIYFYFNKLPSDGMILNLGRMKNCEIVEYEI